ncbi:ATP-binding cassette domain-containing protein [Sphingomonas histidinilytica]|jgi:ATP-binding cassette subfamily B protein|uniref:ATP-binding cassette, subfamily B n=1 Tax=Rhizorhabdus histidinilytica TaxID=439228 RepID=A0A1T5F7N3_9SPHN|nr:ABC transporter transmembrane domain-containing protein [Rhizorhabdus histidinilytica]MBO9380641.1 ATP-binding cassette domain-containing protein [Rhizorhabdus histidinilytica]QEH77932.1 ATP-binding cassette domain-containing protein [Sphingomonas sp. C8-2]SKB92179.1 ATP-binding cassette, subfamily B [Rhizorhabdus histidinilytica]
MARRDPNPEASERKLGELTMIWRFARRYPGRIASALAALVVAAGATLAIPGGFRLVIDKGFIASGGDVGPYFQYLLLIVLVLSLATATRFYFVSWMGERVVADIRIAVQANLLRLAPRFFEENRPSEIASRLTADTAIIEQVVGTTVSVALRNIVLAIGGIIYLFAIAPKLAAMLLLGIPVVMLPVILMGRRLRNLSRSTQDRIADVGATVSETLRAMKIVQGFNQEAREAERFGAVVGSSFDTARRRIRTRAVMTAIIIGLIFGSITMVMWQGAIDVANGRLSGGSIAAFILTGGLVAGAFGALAEVYGDIVRAAGAAARLSELLTAEAEIKAPAHPIALPQPPRGQLAFEHVGFRYPTRPEVLALDDVSFTVEPGEMVAVVGPSGAGKSTILQLAQRFYDPESGTIRLDGIALPDADPADIRARIAVVPQETVLFGASARDNLRYGRWDADDDTIWAAAEAANAASFLRALPDGLDSFLGEAGARLSGGQRQRIAIARAILRDAPLLLLDEATSALDAESERLVQDALDRLMKERTTIVIAHRLATVRAADRILVMDQGRIVEQGDHATLSAQGGLYARLARLQFNDVAA